MKDAKALNDAFADAVVKDALALVQKKVESAQSQNEISTETWYTIGIPFAEGSEEHAHFTAMLTRGSMKDPNYLDLFEKVLSGVKAGLRQTCARAFVTLNCRFDANCDDNFLLYVFTS